MLSAATSSLLRNGATNSFISRMAFRSSRSVVFSTGSHDDFAPKRKVVENQDEAIKMIQVCHVVA